MKSLIRPLGVSMLLGCATAASAQGLSQETKVDRVDIKFIGPESVSQDFVRANIKLKAGDTYLTGLTQDDIHSLYSTGQFYSISVGVDRADDGGVILTYKVQPRPRITEIKIEGYNELTYNNIKKKITAKVGEPLDEQKLFTDVQAIKKTYEKYGLPGTVVKYVLSIDEASGHGIVTFHIEESPKVKITEVDFLGAQAFTEKKLRSEIKTRRRWMFSWITGSGYFKQDEFDADHDALTDFYRERGYLDFEIKDVKIEHPTPNSMVVKYYLSEGHQYKVGAVSITGNTLFGHDEIVKGLRGIHEYQHLTSKLGPNGLPMDTGDTFTPAGMEKDITAVEDFYGSRGYVDVTRSAALRINRVPNVETGTMDLEFRVGENQKNYVQKIEIRGNLKTKDKVIRRELAISPGEVLDMVRVKMSQQRLEYMNYFSKVEIEPEPTDPPIAGKKDLVVNVEEKNTGNFTIGAGISSVDGLVGYITVEQRNFDLMKPPYFTGAGQKIKLMVQVGTERQDYEIQFTEPWFLNRKLQFGVDLYRHELDFESPNNIFNETRTGARFSLTRALWSENFIGSVDYNLEQVGISLNDGWHAEQGAFPRINPQNVPQDILDATGIHMFQRAGASLAYDTRNSVQLPNHGQRTELTAEVSDELTSGNANYYKLELTSSWYFPGFFKGHVIEVGGRTGVADSFNGTDVPFYDRFYLGGLYSMRGFKYRNVSPRDPSYGGSGPGSNPYMPNEPIGGDSYWFGSIEYSLPIFEKDGGVSLRVAAFYDIGAVASDPWSFNGDYDDDVGLGLRLNIPALGGPIRLDYGFPITHDKYNGSSGQFQFGFGYVRPF
ncbi:MAG TPA: outer membrane protein assembly factor BamA [Verrucomicrobiae bacterium]|jgi:outer membrane protein insertion porin family